MFETRNPEYRAAVQRIFTQAPFVRPRHRARRLGPLVWTRMAIAIVTASITATFMRESRRRSPITAHAAASTLSDAENRSFRSSSLNPLLRQWRCLRVVPPC